jgi:membrane protein YqaA with SNARE-associated domain
MEVLEWFRQLGIWMIHWAQTPYGGLALFVLAFCESSFFPIPPDVLLIALSVANSSLAFWYALLCSLGSVLGGVFGYGLGRIGGRPLLERWVRAVAGFTPIPYKVFTVSAGAFLLDFWRFVLASILSRSARFFLVAGLFFFFGPTINQLISRYLNVFSVLFIILLLLGFWFLRVSSKGAMRNP